MIEASLDTDRMLMISCPAHTVSGVIQLLHALSIEHTPAREQVTALLSREHSAAGCGSKGSPSWPALRLQRSEGESDVQGGEGPGTIVVAVVVRARPVRTARLPARAGW